MKNETVKMQYGTCLFCGQMIQLIPDPEESGSDLEGMSPIEKNRRATEQCNCAAALSAKRRKNALDKCRTEIYDMFEDDEKGTLDLLILATTFIRQGTIQKMTIRDCDDVMITIADKGDKGIEISRSVKRKEARLL